jgi:hypothetical protein
MTRTLASHPETHDLVRGRDGNLAIATGAEAVAHNCKTAMQAQLGEMQYAMDRGMPTIATARTNYRPAQFEAAARAILASVAGVRAVTSFTVAREGEALRYTAAVQTVYGEIAVNG